MAILALQGIRGGTGTTSLTAALAWALNALNEKVLVIDGSPDNHLRLFFNIDFTRTEGWARAMLDGQAWRSAAWRYTPNLDVLPFGQLNETERDAACYQETPLSQFREAIEMLKASGQYQWILFDLSHGGAPLTRQFLAAADRILMVVNPDNNCHVRLHQQALPRHTHLLLNDLRIGSQMQDDLLQIWLQSQRTLLPVQIHRAEAMAECLAAKQPLGEYWPDALVAEEVMTLASWCLIHYGGSTV